MFPLETLDATLDLWACMWTQEEQWAFETALVRAMTDTHARPIRLGALAAASAISSSRLRVAVKQVFARGPFSPDELDAVERAAGPRRVRLRAGERLRGNRVAVELLLARAAEGPDPAASVLLDAIDLRDLVEVARSTKDQRLFSEVARTLARRGKYQRRRAAALGYGTGATYSPALSVDWLNV